jgi:hypothetical protein
MRRRLTTCKSAPASSGDSSSPPYPNSSPSLEAQTSARRARTSSSSSAVQASQRSRTSRYRGSPGRSRCAAGPPPHQRQQHQRVGQRHPMVVERHHRDRPHPAPAGRRPARAPAPRSGPARAALRRSLAELLDAPPAAVAHSTPFDRTPAIMHAATDASATTHLCLLLMIRVDCRTTETQRSGSIAHAIDHGDPTTNREMSVPASQVPVVIASPAACLPTGDRLWSRAEEAVMSSAHSMGCAEHALAKRAGSHLRRRHRECEGWLTPTEAF